MDNQQRPLFIYLRAINIKKMKIIIELKKDFMKLINKLFEWLGYVPKEGYKYQVMREVSEYFKSLALNKQAGYEVRYMSSYCEVVLYGAYHYSIVIKIFQYDDDAEYARLCAEELCEKLNERI